MATPSRCGLRGLSRAVHGHIQEEAGRTPFLPELHRRRGDRPTAVAGRLDGHAASGIAGDIEAEDQLVARPGLDELDDHPVGVPRHFRVDAVLGIPVGHQAGVGPHRLLEAGHMVGANQAVEGVGQQPWLAAGRPRRLDRAVELGSPGGLRAADDSAHPVEGLGVGRHPSLDGSAGLPGQPAELGVTVIRPRWWRAPG